MRKAKTAITELIRDREIFAAGLGGSSAGAVVGAISGEPGFILVGSPLLRSRSTQRRLRTRLITHGHLWQVGTK